MPTLVEGSRIGPYRLLRKIGEGGMGAVFEGLHTAIERHVAIKVLHPEYAARQDVVGRFFNEARAANLIDHPSVVQIADFGQTSDGTAYIVMEFLRGETLSKRLRKGPLPCAEAVNLTRTIAGVLAAAHDKNIVHRDLKPDNIMLIPDPERPGSERLKLLDFGIAKLLEAEQAGMVATRTNMVMGTPSYMSPEQCRGAKQVDARSDVYSLGVMLYEMLAGRRPFIAEDSGSLIGMHLFQEPTPLREIAPQVPEPVAALVHLLLSKDKKQRPAMRELYRQLQVLAGDGAVMTTGVQGSWLTSIFRTLRPGRADNSTLNRSAGQLDNRPKGGIGERPAMIVSGMATLLVGGGIVYFISAAGHPARIPAVRSAAAPARPVPPPVPVVMPAPPAPPPVPPPSGPVSSARTVRWEIASDPAGAEVVRLADGVVLGKTPLMHEQPAQSGRALLRLRLAGYQPAQLTLSQDSDGQVDKRLVRIPTGGPPLPPKAPFPLVPHVSAASTPPTPTKSVETPHAKPRPRAEDLLEK